ncbi:sensor histidine kinase [Clostridium paraputrificum]|uniref:sensor histidine kinase n=1 Tax=Clostridium paraputrificum TaxID=29363 RepID=UPI0003F6AAB6|nr:HAMP domain-containing sensor histidine kinase [Clostridium paraputrificum]
MIKIKKIKLNLILGVLVAFLLYQIIISEGYAILVARQQSGNINLDVPVQGINFVKVFAFAIFLATIIIFNTKRFRKINFNKISLYLILTVIVSILAGIEIVIMLMRIILVMCPNVIDFISNNYLVSINSVYFIILLGIGTFLFVFLTLVNRKVKYIKFLTKEVKRIKDDGFGKTIEVKGNDELAQLCDSINNMSLELGEKIENEKIMEKNKSELITNVSHDLRTPLTSIIGYVDLLKKNGFQDKDKFKEYIDVIDERTRSLNKLINELFEYTKLTSHDIKLNYSKVEIGSLVEQLVGEYTPIFNREGLKVYKDISSEDIFINIDVEKIVRVLENLLTNAKKYSLRNDKVLVTLYKEDDEYVVISLANKTKNIDKDELNNIFERFYKVDKSRKEQDSAGLGLSIVKRIVELHNGEVNAELDNDVIEFIVKLPLK